MQFCDVTVVEHPRQALHGDANGERFDLAGPQRHDPIVDGSKREASDTIKKAPHRQHTLYSVHFRAGTKIHLFRCASSPHATRFAGLARGPRIDPHFTACTTVRVMLTAVCAVYTADIMLARVVVSKPKAPAMRGISPAESIRPKPSRA